MRAIIRLLRGNDNGYLKLGDGKNRPIHSLQEAIKSIVDTCIEGHDSEPKTDKVLTDESAGCGDRFDTCSEGVTALLVICLIGRTIDARHDR